MKNFSKEKKSKKIMLRDVIKDKKKASTKRIISKNSFGRRDN